MNMNKKISSGMFFCIAFLYCFILGQIGDVDFSILSILVSTGLALPLAFAWHFKDGKILKNKAGHLFVRMPLAAFGVSLLISVLIELMFFSSNSSAFMGVLLWPTFAIVYIIISVLLSMLSALYVYGELTHAHWRPKLRRGILLLLVLPYAAAILGLLNN